MSFDQIMAGLLLVYAILLATLITAQIVGSSIYELQKTKQAKQRRLHPYAKAYRRKPLVTIIVMSHNHAATISRCLDSLRCNTYRKLQIIIIDNASTDGSKAIIKAYLAQYPKLNAKLISKRKPTRTAEAILAAQRQIKGELVVVMHASEVLARPAIKQLVDSSQGTTEQIVIFITSLIPRPDSLGSLLKTYLNLLNQRARKLNVLMQKPAQPNLLACKKSALKTILKQRPTVSQRAFNLLQAGVTLLTPLLISYFLYLAVNLKEPLFLLLSMGGLALLLFFAIWENDQLQFKQRLAYTLGIPLTYGLMFIRAWLALFTGFRSISHV